VYPGVLAISQSSGLGTGPITLSGGTLSNTASLNLNSLNLTATASTVSTINMPVQMRLPNLYGSGTLNITAQGTGVDSSHYRDAFSACVNYSGTMNITGVVANAQMNFYFNGGSSDGQLQNAVVNLDNVSLVGVNHSGGDTAQIGEVNVHANATLAGGYYAGYQAYTIGAKNTTSDIEGNITDGTVSCRITKTGTGNMIVAGGNNTYTGSTWVNGGTLTVLGTIYSSPMTNYTGTTLAGTGSCASVDLEAGSTVSPGVNDYGTLTSSSDWTFNGGTNLAQISTTNGDLITVGGNLNLASGTVRLAVGDTLTNGVYKLIGYSGALSGSAGNLTLNGFSQAGQTAVLSDTTAYEIDLIVAPVGGANLIWANAGAQNNIWDIVNSLNWSNGPSVTYFTTSDHVTFNDSGAGNNPVDVRAIVQPSTTLVTGSSAYVFQTTTGGGKLSGATNSLVVSGTGSLELDIMSDYGGPTTIGSGTTLTVGNGAISASIGSGLVTNNGTLVFNSTNNISLTNIVGTGAGTLTKNGASTLTLTANNTYNWTTIGSGATLQVGTGGATGSLGSGSVTNDGKLVYNKTGSITVANVKTGPADGGEVDFIGAANVTLNTGNTYINNTVINNGLVTLAAAEAIPSAATVPSSTGWLVLDGGATAAGTLDLKGFNQTVNALSGNNGTVNGLITNSATSGGTNTLTIIGGAATTYNGLIQGNGASGAIALVATGTGSLTLAKANAYIGGTIVAGGTLTLANNTAAGSGSITLSNGATLGLNTGSVNNDIHVGTDATATNLSSGLTDAYSGLFFGDATSTNVFAGSSSISQAATEQFASFLGTVQIAPGSGIRFSASTSFFDNGGRNTTFDVEGSLSTRNQMSTGGAIWLGALNGAGTLAGGNTGGGNVHFNIGDKNIDSTFSGTIKDGSGPETVSITKRGTGTLTLSGSVTNTGTTTINNGTLALAGSATLDNSPTITLNSNSCVLDVSAITTLNLGNVLAQTLTGIGTITGDLNNQANSTVKVGLGVLNVTGSATLNGTNLLQLNRTNSPHGSELTAASFSVAGPLTVLNAGPALQGGDTFQLFSTGVTGFTATNLPTLTGSMYWTNKLALDGSIAVINPVNTTPTNITATVSGNVLTLAWPADHTGWHLQIQTNTVSVGLVANAANWVTLPGSDLVNTTNMTINPANGTVFYRMVYP
jgi:fibronectin-binding autotransporter adhesin